MKKSEQEFVNALCETAFGNAMHEFDEWSSDCGRLRTCTASVFETEHYYLLKSYSTFVAVINKKTDACFDVLRMVYGYTATSAQHIAKFRHDFGSGKWGCETVYTYR